MFKNYFTTKCERYLRRPTLHSERSLARGWPVTKHVWNVKMRAAGLNTCGET